MFSNIKKGLMKTRGQLSEGLKTLLHGRNKVDKQLLEDIEMQLLSSDVGIDATNEILEKLESKARSQSINESGQLIDTVKDELESLLQKCSKPLCTKKDKKPFVILVVGVNGVGKTTTARILAKALNCKDSTNGNPCNTCSICNEITEYRNLDVLEIDGASNRGIEEIRNLRELIKFAPMNSSYKIFIIDS